MKATLIFMFLVACAWGAPRVKRQIFGDVNLKTIPAIMKNPAAVGSHVKCLLATKEEAATICDRIGNRLREQFPKIVELARCPDQCTAEESKAAAHIVRALSDKYPNHWFNIVAHFKITPEKLKQLDAWMASVKE